MARYTRHQLEALETQPLDDLVAGRVRFDAAFALPVGTG